MRTLVRVLGSNATFSVTDFRNALILLFLLSHWSIFFFLAYHDFCCTKSWLKTLPVSILTKKRKPKSTMGVKSKTPLIN